MMCMCVFGCERLQYLQASWVPHIPTGTQSCLSLAAVSLPVRMLWCSLKYCVYTKVDAVLCSGFQFSSSPQIYSLIKSFML